MVTVTHFSYTFYKILRWYFACCRQIRVSNHAQHVEQKSHIFILFCVVNVAAMLKFGKNYNKYKQEFILMQASNGPQENNCCLNRHWLFT